MENLEYNSFGHKRATDPALQHSKEPDFPSWALDFQALQLDERHKPPISSSQLREQAPLHLNFQRGRHPENLRPKSQTVLPNEFQKKSQFSGTFGRIYQPHYDLVNQTANLVPSQSLQNARLNYPAEESVYEDAFQRAFDAAEQSLEKSAASTANVFSAHAQETLTDPVPENLTPQLEEVSEQHSWDHDADALARTAGELLDNMKHEDNPKFRKSNFLELMRQLRDREVHVEGDKIVDVGIP